MKELRETFQANSLNASLDALLEQSKNIADQITVMQKQLGRAKDAWPDYQIRCGAEWYSREKTPPQGFVWASDGVRVWLIHGNGEPISKYATAVKFWTEAYIPTPPEFIKR